METAMASTSENTDLFAVTEVLHLETSALAPFDSDEGQENLSGAGNVPGMSGSGMSKTLQCLCAGALSVASTSDDEERLDQNTVLCLNAGRDLRLYEVDEAMRPAEEQARFNLSVDVLAWNSSGNCFCVGDSQGCLHFINERGTLLFSQKMLNDVKQRFDCMTFLDQPSFFDSEQVGEELFISCRNPAKLFRFSNLCLHLLENAAEAGNTALLKSVRDSATIQSFDLASSCPEGSMGMLVARNEVSGFLRVLLGSRDAPRLNVWVSADSRSPLYLDRFGSDPLDNVSPFTALESTASQNIVVTLTQRGRISIWDARRAIFLRCLCTNPDIVDIANMGPGARLGMLLTSGAVRVARIRLHGAKTLEPLFESEPRKNQTRPGSLVTLPGSRCIALYQHEDGVTGVMCFESNEAMRFESLLTAGRFDDALTLAVQHDLPGRDRALKGKLSQLLETARSSLLQSSEETTDLPEPIYEKFFAVANQLVSLNPQRFLSYVVQGCLQVKLPGAALAQRRLLRKAEELCIEHDDGELLNMAKDALYRLETYTLLSESFDCEEWQRFRMCKLMQALTLFLQKGQLQMASVVLHRHLGVDDDVVHLLEYIPAETPSETMVGWIKDHVGPHVRSHEQKVELAGWAVFIASKIHDAARALALVQEVGMIASTQVQTEREKLKLSLCSPGELARQAAESGPRPHDHSLAELERLRTDLEEVLHLSNVHNLQIDIDTFRSASREEVLMDMVDRVTAPELVKKAVHDHLRPCAQRYGINADEVLVKYIERVALEIDSSNSAREQCAVKAVDQISDLKDASRAVLSLMRNIVPPYSDELTALVERSMTWTTDMQGEVLDQKRLMDLSALLSSFQLNQQLNFNSLNQAKSILMYVLSQSDAVAERAVKIAQVYRFDVADVFATLFENMSLQTESPDEIKVKQLHALMVEITNAEVVRAVEERVRHFCTWGLAEDSDAETDQERIYVAKLGALVGQCGGHEWAAGFEAARELLEEFSIKLDLQDFSLDGDAEGLLELHVMREHASTSTTDLERRACLLGFSKEQMAGRVAVWLARQGHLEACLAWSGRPMGLYWRQRLAVELAVRFSKSSSAQRVGHALLVDICLHSKESTQLSRAVELLRSSSLVQSVLDRCGDGFDWDMDDATVTPGLQQAHELHAWFREYGTVLESGAVLPLLTRFLFALGARHNPVVPAENLIEHLSQNGALQLALRVAGLAINSDLQVAESLVRSLGEKVLSAPKIDVDLALGYLIADDETSLSTYRSSLPKNERGNYARLQTLAGVGVTLGRFHRTQSLVTDCHRMQENSYWWRWLQSLGVEFDSLQFTAEGCKPAQYLQQALLPQCIPKSGYDLKNIDSFASQYHVPSDVIYGLYLKLVLLDENADLETLRDNIALATSRLADDLLLQMCQYVFPRIPGTSYERLEAVCRLCDWPGRSKYLQVLELLRICDVRLDIHALFEGDSWRTLEACLEPDTVKWLVALSDPLDLDPNDFYLCLVRKLMRAGESVTKTVLPVLNNVKAQGRVLEACTWLVSQVEAPEAKLLILRFALERAESDDMAVLANQLATQLDLRHAGINTKLPNKRADVDYSKLIADLYDRFGPVAATQWQDRHRLHQVAEQLAERHQVNLLEVRKRLVLEWLSASSSSGTSAQETQQREENLLQRIVYTMSPRSGRNVDRETCLGIAYLLNYAFQGNVPGRTFASRARALKAVFRLGTMEQIESVYSTREDDTLPLAEHLQYSIYMATFEDLHLPHTFDQLVSCDKRGLVRGLWRDHRGNRQAVQLIAHLMVDFDLLDEPNVVQALLKQMLALGMRREFFFTVQQIVQRRVDVAEVPSLFAEARRQSQQEDAGDVPLQELIEALVRCYPGLVQKHS